MQSSQRLLRIVTLSAMLSSTLLTACGTTNNLPPETRIVIREHYTAPTPDFSLRTCKPRPAKPVLRDDTDEAVLIADLDERGEDCSAKLSQTWKSIDDASTHAANLNRDQPK